MSNETREQFEQRMENTGKGMNYVYVVIPLAIVLFVIALGFLYAACTGALR